MNFISETVSSLARLSISQELCLFPVLDLMEGMIVSFCSCLVELQTKEYDSYYSSTEDNSTNKRCCIKLTPLIWFTLWGIGTTCWANRRWLRWWCGLSWNIHGGTYTSGYFTWIPKSIRFCISYDCLKQSFIILKTELISAENMTLSGTTSWHYVPVVKSFATWSQMNFMTCWSATKKQQCYMIKFLMTLGLSTAVTDGFGFYYPSIGP